MVAWGPSVDGAGREEERRQQVLESTRCGPTTIGRGVFESAHLRERCTLTSDHSLPDDVIRLLSGPISTIGDLEVLLFLRRRPAGSWDPRAVADLLRIDRALAAAIFKQLAGRGFLSYTTEPLLLYQYAPPPEVAETMDRLAAIYDEHRMMVITFLAGRRAVASPPGLRAFADAFRLRNRR